MSDKDITSPFNNSTISRRQVMRIKKIYQLEYYRPIQHHILQTNITRIARQTARRITNEQWEMQHFNTFLVGLLLLLLTPYVSLVSGVYCSTKSLFKSSEILPRS